MLSIHKYGSGLRIPELSVSLDANGAEGDYIFISHAHSDHIPGSPKSQHLYATSPTLALAPSLMIEVEFDDIQVNKRTKAGYTLRLPRFRSIRWDLGPEDSDTLKDVEALYQEKLNKKRKKQDQNPSFLFTPKS